MKTRKTIANDLRSGVNQEQHAEYNEYQDHLDIADMVENGDTWESLQNDEQLNKWPETYMWLKNELESIEEVN